MWCINPRLLCRENLLGEHNELHKLVGGINNHEHGVAIAEGQAAKGNIDTSRIDDRHDDLVEEMQHRGYGHASPLSYDDDLDIGDVDEVGNREELADRCEDCRQRIERGAIST
jgi:hypothetical protein